MEQRRRLILLFGIIYLLPHLFLLAEDRYHMAIVPLLAVVAGNAWVERDHIMAKARLQPKKLILAVLLVGLLWLNWGAELWRDADKLAILFGPNGNHAGFPY